MITGAALGDTARGGPGAAPGQAVAADGFPGSGARAAPGAWRGRRPGRPAPAAVRRTVLPIRRNPGLTRRFVVSPEQFGTLFLGRNDGAAAASDEAESPGHWGMV